MKNYRTVHITSELLKHFIGGIGTVVSQLYNNRKSDEAFLFVAPSNTPLDVYNDYFKDDIFKINFDKYNELLSFPINCETIYIHSFKLLANTRFKTNAKKVFVVHSLTPVEQRYLNKDISHEVTEFLFSLLKVDELVVVSRSEKEKLQEIMAANSLPPKPIKVIYNGADPIFNPKANINNSGMLGYIGRIENRKGIFSLMQEMKDINDYKLVLACGGRGNFDPFLIEKFSLLIDSCKDKVIPLGFLKGERKEAFYNKIEALVIPSLYEPFGMVVLEGIAKGLPIIGSNIGGIKEILGGNYPLLFNPNKRGDFKRVLSLYEIYKVNGLLTDLVTKNFEVLERFSIEKTVNQYRGC